MTELLYDFKIEVETQYLSSQSDEEISQFGFSYTVSICNVGALSAQLISRHWFITDGNAEIKEVRGLGVIGEQPTIAPGQCYRYMSGVRLPTPFGTMHGSYQMLTKDRRLIDVNIPVFRLATPELVN
jgi:ApaG protein